MSQTTIFDINPERAPTLNEVLRHLGWTRGEIHNHHHWWIFDEHGEPVGTFTARNLWWYLRQIGRYPF